MKDSKEKVVRGYALPIGARADENGINISFICEGDGAAVLHLYKKGDSKETAAYEFPAENRAGSLRYMGLQGICASDYDYSITVDGCPVPDSYAATVKGDEEWGRAYTPADLRYSFPSEYDWKDDAAPGYSMEELVIYRLHVRGFTKHPSSGVKDPGTFAGIVQKIPYMKKLGINMAELLMPCDFSELTLQKASDQSGAPENAARAPKGAVRADTRLNYWGYGPAYGMAPKTAFAVPGAGAADVQFKDMVRKLHANGIEVCVELYFDSSQGGYALDCVRHWVMEYHVDAVRISGSVDCNMIANDPALSGVKLFGAYFNGVERQNEHLAVRSDDFQNVMRSFLKGSEGTLRAVTDRVRDGSRRVNSMADTNGFTMFDMVAYDQKHNEANGENGLDGREYENSWNCGAEGATKSRGIRALRLRQLRNAWVMLMTSSAIPMFLAGDEMANTQGGNNNAWCQDNETGWVVWSKTSFSRNVLEFARYMIKFRNSHPILRRGSSLGNVTYENMREPAFSVHGETPWFPQYEISRRQIAFAYRGVSIGDDDIYIMYNMHWEPHTFSVPKAENGWLIAVDTAADEANGIFEEPVPLEDRTLELKPRSAVILISRRQGAMDEA